MSNDVESFIGTDIKYPPGTIIVWHGDPDKAPHGWMFCDGMNGTPDLRNRHLKSVPNTTTDPGTNVGQDSYTLVNAQLPAHSHSASSTGTTGSHRHANTHTKGGQSYSGTTYTGYEANESGSSTFTTRSVSDHSHYINTGTTGSDNSVDNRPKEQSVTLIQKV